MGSVDVDPEGLKNRKEAEKEAEEGGGENAKEGGGEREFGNLRNGSRGGLEDVRAGATTTNNQQSQLQGRTPQRYRRIMRRIRAKDGR